MGHQYETIRRPASAQQSGPPSEHVQEEEELTYTGNAEELTGDLSGLEGDVSNIQGDISAIYGDASGLAGDVSDVSGDVTRIRSVTSATLLADVQREAHEA